jgi:hypothetical protein
VENIYKPTNIHYMKRQIKSIGPIFVLPIKKNLRTYLKAKGEWKFTMDE